MNIQVFFQKMREVEASIKDAFVLVTSMDTSDGGKAGQVMEVTRLCAAKLIVDGRARLANEEEVAIYQEEGDKARALVQQSALGRFPLAVLSEQEMRTLRQSLRPQKG